jgi:ATP-dependent DNA helicase PIF1
MELSREQQIAFDKYVEGHNIFITGPGGVGKSALIKKIYEHAIRRSKNINVTAMTGCAAVLLNCKAKTLHSWAGIGLANSSIEQLLKKIMKNKISKMTWKNTDILVIDEISMLSLKLFETLNQIGKNIRNNQKPFGGIQLIFSGDFYQLPPIGNKDEPDTIKFCFESNDWNSVFHRNCQIQLTKIYRQTDENYRNILNQIREGKIKRKTNDLLLEYVGRDLSANKNLIVEPTKLYPTKNRVEYINNMRMELLDTELREYELKYIYDIEMSKTEKMSRTNLTPSDIKSELDYLSSNLLCDNLIKVKIGSQVMCIINIQTEHGGLEICNGSQGIVTGFCEMTRNPIVKFNNGKIMTMTRHIWTSEKIPGIGVSQIPLILAWALTIHKSQGATLDVAEIDVGSGIFECGQTYVALSRVKSLEGLYLKSFDVSKIKINKKVKDYYESLTTYQQSMFEHEEIYVPLVISENNTDIKMLDMKK